MSEFVDNGNILRLDWMFNDDTPISVGLEEFFV